MNTLKYGLVSVSYWMGFSAIMAFTSTYLLEVGFSNTSIGVLLAVAGVISAFLQPLVASYADKENSLSLRRIIFILGSLNVILGAIITITHGDSLVLSGILYGSAIMLLQLLLPFVNALGMESISQGRKLNFGVARAAGSIGYAVASYILGLVVAKNSVVFVPVAITVTFLCFLIALLFYPKEKSKHISEKVETSNTNPIQFFRKYKRFTWVLAGLVCIYISHILLNNFTMQIITSKGGGSGEMGTSMAIAAMVELPVLIFFSQIVKKVRCDILVRIASVFFALKALGSLLVSTVIAYYAVQTLQMLAWGLLAAALVYYVNGIMEKQDAVKGQAYATMMYTLGSVFGSLIGGKLLDSAGVEELLLFGVIIAVVGTVIILFAAEKTEVA